MKALLITCTALYILLLTGCSEDTERPDITLTSVRIGQVDLMPTGIVENVPVNQSIVLVFSLPVSPEAVESAVSLHQNQQPVSLTFTYSNNNRTVTLQPTQVLSNGSDYTLDITNQLKGSSGENFSGRSFSFRTVVAGLKVLEWTLGGVHPQTTPITEVPLNIDLRIKFDSPVRAESISGASVSLSGPSDAALSFQLSADASELAITATEELLDLGKYTLAINSEIEGADGETFIGFSIQFYTAAGNSPDFPVISDEELIELTQRQTFKYFWDFAHPASGMARERNTSGDVVTSGGSGFGIMALIVGMHRNFISREQGLQRMDRIITFLESADRFHGAWPHWMNGHTGDVVPFSADDNGGDLVETSFLMQGLLTFRQYLDGNVIEEKSLIDRINTLWHDVEWDWYTRGGQNVLYWHWSPDKQWAMNHPIRGYNEALITYFLAAASPDHAIEPSVYHEGWAANGAIRNNKTFYGIGLPLGYDYGGPLFFAHYSFLGLDPRGLQDTYANYWTQNVNHSLINHAYSIDNPKNFVGYSDASWGLTASDNRQGYSAHSPTNDLGVITPTAALSSFPYTPEESMKALHFFYYTLGDRLWGPYGFYDAFNVTEGWTADSYLAIDQGPIIVMIENYRSGLLWDLFMSSPEVAAAMDKLGFTN